MKIELKAGVRYVYANGSVFCEPVEESEQLPGAAKNPILIIEILSKTTASYDRGKKEAWYRMMPSLRDYVMITQSRPSISHYSRKDPLTLYTYRDLIGLDAKASASPSPSPTSTKTSPPTRKHHISHNPSTNPSRHTDKPRNKRSRHLHQLRLPGHHLADVFVGRRCLVQPTAAWPGSRHTRRRVPV